LLTVCIAVCNVDSACVSIWQNMFDLTLSQALGFSNKKESDIATSSKLNKVIFLIFTTSNEIKFTHCCQLQNVRLGCSVFCVTFTHCFIVCVKM